MKISGRIYKNTNGQFILPLKKVIIEELNIKESVDVMIDVQHATLIVEISPQQYKKIYK